MSKNFWYVLHTTEFPFSGSDCRVTRTKLHPQSPDGWGTTEIISRLQVYWKGVYLVEKGLVINYVTLNTLYTVSHLIYGWIKKRTGCWEGLSLGCKFRWFSGNKLWHGVKSHWSAESATFGHAVQIEFRECMTNLKALLHSVSSCNAAVCYQNRYSKRADVLWTLQLFYLRMQTIKVHLYNYPIYCASN
jgi:hypothetical protein